MECNKWNAINDAAMNAAKYKSNDNVINPSHYLSH
jgi:hypothetical protein